jgi:hypothetical protein
VPPASAYGKFVIIDRSRFGEDALVSAMEDVGGSETSNQSAGDSTNLTSKHIDGSGNLDPDRVES